eukprot:Tbor_TRINITY_DN5690_c5_g2::TRINITY_DN5690_c5_g2_i1::g.9367::m.9367/K18749/LSM14, RAP55, SCD6; protein LSM14
MTDSNIGSRITVISKANIRYEGFMNFIDSEESTIGLKDVRMYGSEGRRGGGADEIKASPQHYDFIVFRGADISNVSVHENDTPTVTDNFNSKGDESRGSTERGHRGGGRGGGGNSKNNNYQEGINNRNVPRNDRFDMNRGEEVNNNNNNYNNNNYNNNNNNNNSLHGRNNRFDNRDNNRRGGDYSRNYRGGDGGHNDRSNRGFRNNDNFGRRDDRIRPYEGGRGGRNNRYHGGGGYRAQQDFHTGRDFEVATGNARETLKEFDFVKAGVEFEKQKAEFRKEQEKEGLKAPKKYDSSSFFDSISCESKDRKENQGIARHNRDGQRITDTETFGSDMVGTMRGFRRGRARGGRGHYDR